MGTEIFFGKSEIRLDSPVNKPPDGQISRLCRSIRGAEIPDFLLALQGGPLRNRTFRRSIASNNVRCPRVLRTQVGHRGRSEKCQKATLPLTRLTRVAAAAVLGGNALPIQKIDLVEGPTRLIEEQHQPQPIGQIRFAGEIYSWIGHGRDAHATYEAKA